MDTLGKEGRLAFQGQPVLAEKWRPSQEASFISRTAGEVHDVEELYERARADERVHGMFQSLESWEDQTSKKK